MTNIIRSRATQHVSSTSALYKQPAPPTCASPPALPQSSPRPHCARVEDETRLCCMGEVVEVACIGEEVALAFDLCCAGKVVAAAFELCCIGEVVEVAFELRC